MEKFKELISDNDLVLVDFFAHWCGPCQIMTPILDDLKSAVGEKLTIVKVDIDLPANHGLSSLYQIRSVRTLTLFRKGEIVWRNSGVVSTEDLRVIVEKQLETEKQPQ